MNKSILSRNSKPKKMDLCKDKFSLASSSAIKIAESKGSHNIRSKSREYQEKKIQEILHELNNGMRKVVLNGEKGFIKHLIYVVETLKTKCQLYQLNSGILNVTDQAYEPLEEGLDRVSKSKLYPCLSITLSLDPLSSTETGHYQAPSNVVKESNKTFIEKKEAKRSRRSKGNHRVKSSKQNHRKGGRPKTRNRGNSSGNGGSPSA